ncbi:hypothetical protein SH2C18_45610 [Clostridium sediminicola]|uniref:MafI family immunity protein n=1 Tax=Clostridium sediminicola TaxID=3114879 RepID=UPI0031F22378
MNISAEITCIIEKIIEFPEKDKEDIYEFLEHDEWGIALETLYAVLYEEKIPITKSIYDTVISVGEIMDMDSSTWDSLKYLIR